MKVAIIMGSDSDFPVLEPAMKVLNDFDVKYEVLVASAHRTPAKVHAFVSSARENGFGVVIAAAGAAAHLAGVIASFTTLPVIGIPVNATSLGGLDALLSTVQMPPGIPVATMAIDGAKNAAIYALEILAVANDEVSGKLTEYRRNMVQEVEAKNAKVQVKLGLAKE